MQNLLTKMQIGSASQTEFMALSARANACFPDPPIWRRDVKLDPLSRSTSHGVSVDSPCILLALRSRNGAGPVRVASTHVARWCIVFARRFLPRLQLQPLRSGCSRFRRRMMGTSMCMPCDCQSQPRLRMAASKPPSRRNTSAPT